MSKYIFGLHEPGGEHLFEQAGKTGWVTFTHELGRDPTNVDGHDYTPWSDRGFGIIARLNHGYGNTGTIPLPEHYPAFAQRVANFVAGSQGCSVWLISNEPNHSIERPAEQPITYESYAECYTLCRNAIKALPGHENDQVCTAAIAPWNVETGDWLYYFEEMLLLAVEFGGVDAIALHTYTHGSDPVLILDEAKMDPPYDDRLYHFRAYQDFMARIPAELRHVPVYITETDQDDEWENVNRGWVQEAYAEIDGWNRQPNTQSIRCLCLYRWPRYDKYRLEDKTEVQQDFVAAMANDYEWEDKPMSKWEVFYRTSFDEGFHAHDGISELTVPNGFEPDWEEGPEEGMLDRPEFKPKETPQPEVRTPRFAASLGTTFASHRAVLAKTLTGIEAGTDLRITCWAMGVSHHNDGSVGGGLGQVVGIGDAGVSFLDANDWGEWWSSDIEGWAEREWKEIRLEIEAPTDDPVLYLRSDARVAWQAQYSHFDDLLVEVWVENGEPPPPPTDGIQVYIDTLQWDIDVLQADLNALQAYVENSQRLCLLV